MFQMNIKRKINKIDSVVEKLPIHKVDLSVGELPTIIFANYMCILQAQQELDNWQLFIQIGIKMGKKRIEDVT